MQAKNARSRHGCWGAKDASARHACWGHPTQATPCTTVSPDVAVSRNVDACWAEACAGHATRIIATKENVYVVIEAQWKEENGFTVYQALSLEQAVNQNSGKLVYRPKTAKQLLPFTWLRDQKPGALKFTNASRDPVLDLSVNGQHLWEGEGVTWAKAAVKEVGQGAKGAAFVMLEDEVQQIRRLHERLSNAEGRD